VVSDWQTYAQSRQDWVGLGLAPAHLSRAVELACEGDLEPRYHAPSSDESLRQLLLVYRAAVLMTCGVLVSARSAEAPSAEPIPAK
jgi:hypothetical protein